MIDPEARISVPEYVAHRPFEGETVVLNLESGQYHGLNSTAARMFTLLAEHGSIRSAAEAAAEYYGMEVEDVIGDVQDLCDQLAQRGLIAVDARATG